VTYDEIIAQLDEHDPECPERANGTSGGFWSLRVKDLREYLVAGTIDPGQIESLEFFPP
jgi:hypothetical protein